MESLRRLTTGIAPMPGLGVRISKGETMSKVPFSLMSTAIFGGSYDEETQELDLSFSSGRVYTLHNVPKEVVEELQDAPSAGNYFRERMKGRY